MLRIFSCLTVILGRNGHDMEPGMVITLFLILCLRRYL